MRVWERGKKDYKEGRRKAESGKGTRGDIGDDETKNGRGGGIRE